MIGYLWLCLVYNDWLAVIVFSLEWLARAVIVFSLEWLARAVIVSGGDAGAREELAQGREHSAAEGTRQLQPRQGHLQIPRHWQVGSWENTKGLKVPSGQIGSAWEWYHWTAL